MPSLAETRKLAKQEAKLVLSCKFQLLAYDLQIGPASLIRKLIVQDSLSCVVMPLMPLHTKAQKGRRKRHSSLKRGYRGSMLVWRKIEFWVQGPHVGAQVVP